MKLDKIATVFNSSLSHEKPKESLASLVILMEKALDEFASFTEQSLVSKYLQLPWKLNTFPSKVL